MVKELLHGATGHKCESVAIEHLFTVVVASVVVFESLILIDVGTLLALPVRDGTRAERKLSLLVNFLVRRILPILLH